MERFLTDRELMRETVTPIARRTDGTGVSFLFCKRATRDYFKFNELPIPQDHGIPDPSGKGRLIYMQPRKTGANALNLRIAYAWRAKGQKPSLVRIRLGGTPVLDTVQVLTNHLNESGVDWLYIANADGNRFIKGSFQSASL